MKCIPAFFLGAAVLFAQPPESRPAASPRQQFDRPSQGGTRPLRGNAQPSQGTARRVSPEASSTNSFTFATGQAARLVIGQETFTSQDTNSSDTVLGAPSGIAYAGDTLFVADSNRVGATPVNHRVLEFTNLSSQLPDPRAELQYNRKCPVCIGQAAVVLGQPDFVTSTQNNAPTSNSLRSPSAVASDGVHLVVADTDHNRVLIWNHIPANNNAPADVVVGQKNFVTGSLPGDIPNAASLRGPQGVWIQNGALYIADTQNNRVLLFNHIPTTNGASADVVLGAPNFSTFVNPDLTQQQNGATANTMLSPVSVTSDGVHLFVTDLGFNRVLIFNKIPTSNGAAADIVIGQPDMVSSLANNAFTGSAATSSTDSTNKETPVLCTTSRGVDPYGNPVYPNGCAATLNFPRFALGAGGRVFVADGGNDRVLVYESLPSKNGQVADSILGQIGGEINQASDAADSLRTPSSIAWDGSNLYVSDTYNRRIMVYTIGATTVGYQGIRNAASLNITAHGSFAVGGSIQAGDVITITINTATYTYTVITGDTLAGVTQKLVDLINSANSGHGDPYVGALVDVISTTTILLNAKQAGDLGNAVSYSAAVTPPTGANGALISVTASNSSLTGGGDAARLAPGTVVSVLGTNLSSYTASVDPTANSLPTKLGGAEVYFNGIQAPLFLVSPTQINAQIPWELGDTTSISAFVRSEMSDGSVMFTSAVAASIVAANPGLYFDPKTSDPQMAIMYHATSNASALLSVDGSVSAGATATVTINSRSYTYTATGLDTLDTVRDALVVLLSRDPQVTATAAGVFDRIILRARIAGPEGNGIPISVSSGSSSLVLTAIDGATCCGNIANAPVTTTNPALPGELVLVYGTGLGLPILTDAVQPLVQTGVKYPIGGPNTVPQNFVNATAGGATADVLQATMLPGTVGGFQILLHLNSALVTSPTTLLDIAQGQYISNQAAFALLNPSNTSSLDPVLSILANASGTFTLGEQNAYYTLAISNNGGGNSTSGPVTVTETVPDGLTLASMIGDGWNCSGNICTRSDPLSAGSAYPVITVIVNVASDAASSLTNTAHVTGGSSAASTANTVTTVNGTAASGNPNLSVKSTHSGNFTKGQQNATYTLTVSNASGANATSGVVTLNEVLPAGLTAVSMAGDGWTCGTDTCSRNDALSGGKSYPAVTVTVNVSTTAPSSVVNRVVVYGGGSGASSSSDTTTVN